MFETILRFLRESIRTEYSEQLIAAIILVGIGGVAVGVYYLSKWLLSFIDRLIKRTPTEWDDDLFNSRLWRAISQLAPAIAVNWMVPGFFGDNPDRFHLLRVLTSFYILWAIIRILTIFIGNIFNALTRRPQLRPYAVKGIFQMLKLVMIILGVIIGISILIGRSPLAILTAFGASAAVLSLVFKDTILGLVASIQLNVNDMLKKGDWIVVDKHNVNGEVIDVSLTTVKVRNWDNSVSTIPPYSLITDSFRNYDPMLLAGARRVERAIYIDINSVHHCTEAELRAVAAVAPPEFRLPDSPIVNLRLFRQYLETYISGLKHVRTDQMIMVRQLQPTQAGLPVQLYFFTSLTSWKDYEIFQADVFDEVYALVSLFGLRIYQRPAGTDIIQAADPR